MIVMVIWGMGCMLLGASISLMVVHHLMKKSDFEWTAEIKQIKADHEQEIQELCDDWTQFTARILGHDAEEEKTK